MKYFLSLLLFRWTTNTDNGISRIETNYKFFELLNSKQHYKFSSAEIPHKLQLQSLRLLLLKEHQQGPKLTIINLHGVCKS